MSNQRSKSWGHAAGVLPEDQRGYTVRGVWFTYWCAGKCPDPATHWTAYSYVTGRSGRVSHVTRKVCQRHAEQFATRHGIQVTDDAPRPTATQTIIGQQLAGEQ